MNSLIVQTRFTDIQLKGNDKDSKKNSAKCRFRSNKLVCGNVVSSADFLDHIMVRFVFLIQYLLLHNILFLNKESWLHTKGTSVRPYIMATIMSLCGEGSEYIWHLLTWERWGGGVSRRQKCYFKKNIKKEIKKK